MEKFGIGQAVRRVEDERFLKGEGRYVDDISLPDMAHGVFVRSTHAHARIASIDVSEAKVAPGVVAVLGIEDCKAADLGPIPSMTAVDGLDQDTLQHPARYPFADGVVKYVGEPVAFVIAGTSAQARDAAELIVIDYDPVEAVTDLASTLDDTSVQVWPGHDGNRAFLFSKGDRDAVASVFEAAPHVVTLDLINNRVAPSAIEPRGSIGQFDPESGRYTLHLSGQSLHGNRAQMATAVFKTDPDNIRIVAGDVGGGFGAKNFVYPENILVLLAAKVAGRPVKWIAERTETFLAEIHGRDHVTRGELAVDDDGRFLGLRVKTIANMGAYLSSMAPVIPTAASWVSMGGVYDVPAVYMEVEAAFTNTVPVDAYRGAGRPEAAYIIERLVDVAAADLGYEPQDLRRRNFVGAFPYPTSLGMTIDCGDFEGTLSKAVDAAHQDGFVDRRHEAEGRGRLLGFGVSSYLEVTLGAPTESAEIRFEDDGTVSLVVGTHSTGQGHQTTYCQIVHDELGIPFEDMRFIQGDTDLVATGGGHGGSRSLMIGGSAMLDSAQAVRKKALVAAAHVLDADPDELSFEDGLFAVPDTNRRMTLPELEQALNDAPDLPEDVPQTLSSTGSFERSRHSFPNGCHIAEVEVDPETGHVELMRYAVVDDFGRIVNPMIAAGQVLGGSVQGIGQALLEQVVYEPESGQILTGSLMDYALPRADMVPPLDVSFNEAAPTQTNPLGVKGAGEAGATGAPAAIANAVLDALKPHGVRHLEMPFTPEKVWRALQPK